MLNIYHRIEHNTAVYFEIVQRCVPVLDVLLYRATLPNGKKKLSARIPRRVQAKMFSLMTSFIVCYQGILYTRAPAPIGSEPIRIGAEVPSYQLRVRSHFSREMMGRTVRWETIYGNSADGGEHLLAGRHGRRGRGVRTVTGVNAKFLRIKFTSSTGAFRFQRPPEREGR
jgi:hypothetical protein